MQTVDFVIPHMGRPELLIKTIESILMQTALEQIAKIVVVTKNSSALILPAHEKLHLIYSPNAKTISEQRNIGVALGNADYLAFLDADIQLAPDWLASCLTLIAADTNRVVVSAMQKAASGATTIERIRTALSNANVDSAVKFLPGRNILVKRSVNNMVGGFPEHLQTCEDYFYTEQLSHLGTVYYTSATSYIHLGEDTSLKQTFYKEIWRSEYNLRSIIGRKIPMREWPSILLPFFLLAAIILLLYSLFGHISFLAFSLGLVLLPIVAYSLRLLRQPNHNAPVLTIFVFYSVYFAARTIGTIAGIRLLFQRWR